MTDWALMASQAARLAFFDPTQEAAADHGVAFALARPARQLQCIPAAQISAGALRRGIARRAFDREGLVRLLYPRASAGIARQLADINAALDRPDRTLRERGHGNPAKKYRNEKALHVHRHSVERLALP